LGKKELNRYAIYVDLLEAAEHADSVLDFVPAELPASLSLLTRESLNGRGGVGDTLTAGFTLTLLSTAPREDLAVPPLLLHLSSTFGHGADVSTATTEATGFPATLDCLLLTLVAPALQVQLLGRQVHGLTFDSPAASAATAPFMSQFDSVSLVLSAFFSSCSGAASAWADFMTDSPNSSLLESSFGESFSSAMRGKTMEERLAGL
jgi:hypothetical protein